MEDKFVQEGEIQNYISIGKTKIKEIIKSFKFKIKENKMIEKVLTKRNDKIIKETIIIIALTTLLSTISTILTTSF